MESQNREDPCVFSMVLSHDVALSGASKGSVVILDHGDRYNNKHSEPHNLIQPHPEPANFTQIGSRGEDL